MAAIAAVVLITAQPAPPTGQIAAAASPASPAAATSPLNRLISIARSRIGAPYVWGATGSRVFDCIGLVTWSFRSAGLVARIGNGRYQSGYTLYSYYRRRGQASRTGGQPGDIVVWGGGSHVGIYLGHGLAISALVTGVRIAGVHALTTPFTAFLHTGLSGGTTAVAAKVVTKAAKTTPARILSWRLTTSSLRLRGGPSTTAGVLAVLGARTRVAVIASRRDVHGRPWLKVRVGLRTGWVAAWYTRAA